MAKVIRNGMEEATCVPLVDDVSICGVGYGCRALSHVVKQVSTLSR